ncbi:MAG: hypothetical protein V3V16_06670 [Melioribacteraceae bacterium]
MKAELKTTDFDFEYTGSEYTEDGIIAKGHKQITGKILQATIKNTTVFGEYLNGYKFVTDIYDNGTAEGINNVGSHNFGKWIIDFEKNTLQLEWENGWVDTITRAYNVNGNIEFYDIGTGKWRTTFKTFEKWKEE